MSHQTPNRLKHLYIAVLSLLISPFALSLMPFLKIAPLKGDIHKSPTPTFSKDNWITGVFQDSCETFAKENNGLRSFWVRFDNQKHYFLYNEAKANGVIIGKNNYLYELNYIKTIYGQDFIGQKLIHQRIHQLDSIREELSKQNIDLLVVLTPGKGSFYPEFIPDKYKYTITDSTNYNVYLREIKKSNLNYIDFNHWFISMKDTSRYPLFPKTGIHWSKYGELLVADSLLKYIYQLKSIDLSSPLKYSKPKISSNVRHTDDDIEDGMNLLFDIPDLNMAYHQYSWDTSNISKDLKTLVIADSYYWGLYNMKLSQKVFNHSEFWFYNQQIYPSRNQSSTFTHSIDYNKSLKDNNLIILLATDANLYKFPFGFIENVQRSKLN